MKEDKLIVTAPKEKPGWTLTITCKVPETFAEWGRYLGEEVACAKLSEYLKIRRMDMARRLKVGTKTTAGSSDSNIQTAVGDWHWDRVRIQASKKSADEMALDSMRLLLSLCTDVKQKKAIEQTIGLMEERIQKNAVSAEEKAQAEGK